MKKNEKKGYRLFRGLPFIEEICKHMEFHIDAKKSDMGHGKHGKFLMGFLNNENCANYRCYSF